MEETSKLKGTGVDKISALNPALVVDDALDFYLQYSAAKRNLDNKAKRKKAARQLAVKQAGLEDILEHAADKIVNNPKILLPSTRTLATIGAGIATSMYGPEWAGGPSEADITEGKRFDHKRALMSTAGISIVSSMPQKLKTFVSGNTFPKRAIAASSIPAGIIAATEIGKPILEGNKPPELRKTLKRYGKLSTIGLFSASATIGLMEAIKNAASAASAPIPKGALVNIRR